MKAILRYARNFCTNHNGGFIGLDINESYMAMAEITSTKRHHYCLENFAFVPFLHQQTSYETYQQDANSNNAHIDPLSNPATIHHLSAIFAHAPLQQKHIALALPLTLIASKTLTLPCKLKTKEIAAALKLHLNNSDDLDHYQHSKIAPPENDDNVINIRRLHYDVALNEETWFITAAPKTAIRTYLDSFRQASLPLKVAVLDVDLYACARAAVLLELSPQNSFVIANVTVKIIQLGLIVKSNLIETSEYNFEHNENESISATALSQEFIAQTAYEKIQAFLQTIKQHTETIILCGPNATATLKQLLSSLININVILADPFQRLGLGSKLKTSESRNIYGDNSYNLSNNLSLIAPQMMLCCGLSLHGAARDD